MTKSMLLALAIAVLLVGAGCQETVGVNGDASTSRTSSDNASVTPGGEGRVVLSLTDTAATVNGVTAVRVTVDKIEMHSNAKGWVTVSDETKQYDLRALKARNSLTLVGQTMVPEGTYNQIRVHVKKVEVARAKGTSEAKLPSNVIEVTGQFIVSPDTTTSINLGFMSDQSIHITGNGQVIFAPVIKTEARANGTVSIGNDEQVVVSGGTIDTDATMGIDVDGTMKDDFKFETGSLEIKNNTIELVGSTTVKAGSETGVRATVLN